MNRQLTVTEEQLLRWMLEKGTSAGRGFIGQVEKAKVTPFRCPCGCASVNFVVDGLPEPVGGLHILADFVFGTDKDLSGIFVFEQGGVLAGVEVYGLAGEAPKSLPPIDSLRPI